ncbi:MAG: hypothetical protein JW938_06585, partial [Candidatus Omnitrophica bacterium]|nr:hypothetical protein [Candidatus Omnitrophota bacterium]
MLEQLATLKEIDKRFYKITFVILWFALALLCIPFFIFVQGLMLENTFSETANKLIIYEPKGHKLNPPSEMKLFYLSKQMNTLKEIYPKVRALCTAPAIVRQKEELLGSALDFKESLFALKRSLEEKAKILSIAFPDEYGLQEYETQLPREEDLPQLFFNLDLVNFFMTLLLEMPAEKIDYLRFTDVMSRPFSTHDPEHFTVFTTEIAFGG